MPKQSLRHEFWRHYKLKELNPAEWEALCDGCGLCCLVKLRDDDTNEVVYTSVACHLLDCGTGHCSDYFRRKKKVPDCVQLNADMLPSIDWLPKSCAYRCLHELRPLPDWHPLISKNPNTVIQAGVSVAGRCVGELQVKDEDLEEHVVKWVKF